MKKSKNEYMKIIGFLQMFNESEKGNLKRCLDNLSKIADDIVIYDDGSTDDSVEVAKQYTKNIILGEKNDFMNEVSHKQQLLEIALKLNNDYIFWLDADEIVEKKGTEGGIRELCKSGYSYSFPEITLWRSHVWRRVDAWYNGMKFVRLWKNNGMLHFNIARGLHQILFPLNIEIKESDIKIIHFGYADEKTIINRYRRRGELGVPENIRRVAINESELRLEPVDINIFPKTFTPTKFNKPEPMAIETWLRL